MGTTAGRKTRSTDRGYVHVYTGDGKGKTTAALGLALRAAGHGRRVLIIQFMKGRINYGELRGAKRLRPYITIVQSGRAEFVRKGNPDPRDVALARSGIELAERSLRRGQYDLVVLDEINVALEYGLVSLGQVMRILRERPRGLELVLTGRGAHPAVMKAAHLVTEMREIKHYFRSGVMARKGIEW